MKDKKEKQEEEKKMENKKGKVKQSKKADKKKEEPKESKPSREIPAELESWKPKTSLGRKVKKGEIKNIDNILNSGIKILEPQIVDILLPDLEKDLLLIGQSKGKFGGGQRRVFKQTQKKTPEGNKPRFATYAVAGNKNGYVGLGYGKAKETVPAREKAFRNSKLNIKLIKRGCGSWQCGCKTPHSIPFQVEGKCGSTIIRLIPAPKGTGLKAEGSVARILETAGVKDIWSQSFGQTKSKINLIKACEKALDKLNSTKLKKEDYDNLGIIEGKKE